MMNYAYILECADGTYYAGWTNDLQKRFEAHCSGRGARYTRSHKPVRIAWSQAFETKQEAQQTEWQIKHMSRREKEKLVRHETELKPAEKKVIMKKRTEKEKIIMGKLKIVRCAGCGKIAVILKDSACPTKCCGEPMEVLEANTTDAAQEKHVPAVVREGSKITVSVGSVDHPMIPEHYIEFIALETAKGFRIAYLNPGDKPCADFFAEEPVIAVYAYCNLHGLWKTEA